MAPGDGLDTGSFSPTPFVCPRMSARAPSPKIWAIRRLEANGFGGARPLVHALWKSCSPWRNDRNKKEAQPLQLASQFPNAPREFSQ